MKLLVLVTLLAAIDPRVSLRVTPHVLLAGATVRVTCSVPRHPENRGLTIALDGYRSSFVQLDGEASRITHEVSYQHVPCGVERARCEVRDLAGRNYVAEEPVLVSGCE